MRLPPGALESTVATLGLVGLGLGSAAYAAFYPQSQLCGPVLVSPRRPNQIALTFDDGPNPSATPPLLQVLARHGVRATFFLIGENVRREPELTRAIASAGHAIGNHTMSHPWLTFLPKARIHAELAGCNHALEDVLGAPAKLFRPPHGARSPAVLRIARELELATVQWTIIAGDWMPIPASQILSRLHRGLAADLRCGRASNIVLHDGGHNRPRLATVEAVDQLLTRLPDLPARPVFVTPDQWLPSASPFQARNDQDRSL